MLKHKNILMITIMLLAMLSLTACANNQEPAPVEPESTSEVEELEPNKIAGEEVESSVNKRECKKRNHDGSLILE